MRTNRRLLHHVVISITIKLTWSITFAAEPVWHYEPGDYGNRYWGR